MTALTATLREQAEGFIRPSSTSENAACPARPIMQAAVVELLGQRKAAKEADLGNRAHAWGESGIRLLVQDTETCEPLDQISDIESALAELRDEHQKEEPSRRVDPWTWRVVESYVRFVHGLILKYGIEPANVLVEEVLDVAELGYGNGGRSDCLLVIPYDLVVVVDLKAGFVEQEEAADHDQASGYACAAAQRFKAKRVEVWIAQPRQERDRRFSGATFDADALRDTAAWIQAVNRRCRAPDAELIPAYHQCHTCRALTLCPAAQEYIVNASDALALLGKPSTPDTLGALADAAKLAEKFAENGKELVKAELIAGGAATGWKLGAPRAISSVVDVPAALAELEAAGVTAVQLAGYDAISIKVNKLPDEIEAAIASRITESLSSPPLTADRSTKRVA